MSELLEVGVEMRTEDRIMSRELMRWYCDALETAADADGTFKIAAPTIHSSDEYAHSQGLPAIIADGMISTNWISGLLAREFGLWYSGHGSLRTKFVRPIYEDEIVSTHARVTAVERNDAGTLVTMDVWAAVEPDGTLCTVGTATARVPS
jgi:acyl dehydratase